MSAWAFADPDLRSACEQMLRDRRPLREIARALNTSHESVRRYANGVRRESPRPARTQESDDVMHARRSLDIAFTHFENHCDKVSHDLWQEALRAYNQARAQQRDSQ